MRRESTEIEIKKRQKNRTQKKKKQQTRTIQTEKPNQNRQPEIVYSVFVLYIVETRIKILQSPKQG